MQFLGQLVCHVNSVYDLNSPTLTDEFTWVGVAPVVELLSHEIRIRGSISDPGLCYLIQSSVFNTKLTEITYYYSF